MAAIRVPDSAETLMPLCRTSGSGANYIWETYADMVIYLAALAYRSEAGTTTKFKPIRGVTPIELGTFRSRGLYPILLTLAIAETRNWIVAKEPEQIVEIVERFAASGGSLLQRNVQSDEPRAIVKYLIDSLREEALFKI